MIQQRQPEPDHFDAATIASRQSRRAFLAALLLCTIVMVGIYALLYLRYPLYRATALIECVGNAPRLALRIHEPGLAEEPFLRFVRSQAAFIVSAPVIDAVLMDAEVRQTQWFRATPSAALQVQLAKELEAVPIRDTNYIEVSFAARHPADAQIIVNTVVNNYLTIVRNFATGHYRQELAVAKRERNELQDRIDRKAEEIRAFTRQLPLIMSGSDLAPLIEAQRTAEVQFAEADSALVEAETYVDRLESMAGDPSGAGRLAYLASGDPIHAQYARAYADQRMACEMLLIATNGAAPPEGAALKCTLRQGWLEKQMDLRLAELTQVEIERARLQLEPLQRARKHAAERMNQHATELRNAKVMLVDFERIRQEQCEQTDVAQLLSQHIRELERIVRDRDGIQVRAAVAASEPSTCSFPRPWLLAAMLAVSVLLASLSGWLGRRTTTRALSQPPVETMPEA